LEDIERTLRLLASSLLLAGAAAILAAGGVGAAVAGAVLRPLTRVADVARRIVRGDLDSRLVAEGDPDLEPLVGAFNEMLDDLRERIHREARFASDVTHELRGPVAALASAISVANRRRDQLPEQAVMAVDALAAQVEGFNRLVLDLLEISRFDAATAQLDLQPVDLARFVPDVLDRLGCSAVPVRRAEGVSLEVMADERRLHQILANLVQNAQHYAGGVVLVEISATDGMARVAVEDAGPGVPLSEREVIFSRFSRGAAADLPDAPRGTGLGLALVAEHARLHGGRVWVQDRLGGGSRFVVELPGKAS
ncbi:MAG: HAMP domain-containing sensor histidine kinase, partial [Acidimicrobiia bacterium]